jgi:hypothetical protein
MAFCTSVSTGSRRKKLKAMTPTSADVGDVDFGVKARRKRTDLRGGP